MEPLPVLLRPCLEGREDMLLTWELPELRLIVLGHVRPPRVEDRWPDAISKPREGS